MHNKKQKPSSGRTYHVHLNHFQTVFPDELRNWQRKASEQIKQSKKINWKIWKKKQKKVSEEVLKNNWGKKLKKNLKKLF